ASHARVFRETQSWPRDSQRHCSIAVRGVGERSMRAKLFGVLAALACVAAIWGATYQAGLAKDETKMPAMAQGSMKMDHGPNVPAPDMVDNFRLVDQHLVSHDLYELGDAPAIVIAVQGNGCPIVRNTVADLEALKKQFAAQGVEFLMINPNM